MTEPDVIDRIVAGVLEQLRLPSAAAPRPVESSPPPKPIGPTASAIEISDGVITGTLLEERGIISGPLVFGRKSVLTPSARRIPGDSQAQLAAGRFRLRLAAKMRRSGGWPS